MDKYISEAENTKAPDEKKVVITNEAFAIVDAIDSLIERLKVFGRGYG